MRTSQLDEVGNPGAIPGSRSWSIFLRDELRTLIKDTKFNSDILRGYRNTFIKYRGWEALTKRYDKPFVSYEDFCTTKPPFGLGYEPEEIEEIIVERKSAEAQAQNAKDLGKHGGDHMPGDRKQVDDVNLLSQGGNQVSYLTARIKRDHPEILERMKAGEFKSVRQAAIEAGIIKEPTTLELLNRYWKKANPAEQVQFIKNITKDLQKLAIPITFVKLNPTNTRKHEQENRSQTFYQRVDK